MLGRRSKTTTPDAPTTAPAPGTQGAPETGGLVAIPGAPTEPCTPCEAARRARQFSLNGPTQPAMPQVSDDAVPVIAPSVTTDVTDEGVDLSVGGAERTHSLNATAGLIWLTIDGRLDVAGIIADLAGETGAPADQIAPDVRRSITTLVEQGLVTLKTSR